MSNAIVDGAVLFDMTWFVSHPARTGVQRYICELIRHWPRDRSFFPVRIDENARMNIIPLEIFDNIIDYFSSEDEGESELFIEKIKFFHDKSIYVIDNREISCVSAIILPEPTYDWTQVWFYGEIIKSHPGKVFAIVHDFMPWLYPQYFSGLDMTSYGITGYLRFLRKVKNIGFNSNKTKRDFESRILRGTVENSIIIGGGSDAFDGITPHPDHSRPEFVSIATVQPHKQHFLILDVFEKLWASGCNARLTFVGQAGGNLSRDEVARLHRLVETQPLFSWRTNAHDDEVREILSHTTALIYPGTVEGLGLPLLECLRVGIPAIVSSNLPSIEFACGGYVAIDVNFDNLENAVRSFLDPVFAEAKRQEIDRNALPTWKGIAQRTADWIYSSSADDVLEAAGFPTFGYNRRFATARMIHFLNKSEGAAFVQACFKELFGKAPAGSDVVSWAKVWEKNSSSKLDLILMMISSSDFIRARGVEGVQEWMNGFIFYKELPNYGINLE